MKGLTVALILAGTITLTIGGVCFGIGLYNKAQNENVIENSYDITDAFENIDIDLETADLYFKESLDNKVRVDCNDRTKYYQDVTVDSGVLKIKTIDHRKWYEKYIFAFNFKRFDVTVYLPTATYGTLRVKTATGDVDFEKCASFTKATIKTNTGNIAFTNNVSESLEVTSDTGNIKLKELSAKSIKAKTSTGNINIEEAEVEEEVNTYSSTGSHKFNKVNCDTLIAKSSTGGARLIETVAATSFDINTSTGGVRFESCDAGTIKVKTSTGDIKGSLKTNKIFDAHSGTGSVKVPLSGEGGICKLESSTGSINITIE